MGVVVRWDAAHVLVDPDLVDEVCPDHVEEYLVEPLANAGRRLGVVLTPDHHRHRTRLAFSDPAQVVVVEPLGERCRLAQLASGVRGSAHAALTNQTR
jgi:hypothetical protein